MGDKNYLKVAQITIVRINTYRVTHPSKKNLKGQPLWGIKTT